MRVFLYVTREKLHEALSYKKGARRTLIKFTPKVGNMVQCTLWANTKVRNQLYCVDRYTVPAT